jgi:hypothetical protein
MQFFFSDSFYSMFKFLLSFLRKQESAAFYPESIAAAKSFRIRNKGLKQSRRMAAVWSRNYFRDKGWQNLLSGSDPGRPPADSLPAKY